MPENDQTRWIGIRPTNPSENIPTTTRKQAPAIGDLQALFDTACGYNSHGSIDCSVNAWRGTGAMPAGEIHIINSIGAQNLGSMCDIEIWAFIDAIARPLKSEYSVQPNQIVTWAGAIVLLGGDQITVNFVLGGATDPLKVWHVGYQIGAY